MRNYVAIVTYDNETKQFAFMSQTEQGHWQTKDLPGDFELIQTQEGKWLTIDKPKYAGADRRKKKDQSTIKTVVANIKKMFKSELLADDEFTAIAKQVEDRSK